MFSAAQKFCLLLKYVFSSFDIRFPALSTLLHASC
jgi:hypothetical protein